MKSSRMTRVAIWAAVAVAFIGNASAWAAWDYIVESRSGGLNYNKYSDSICADSTAKSSAAGVTPGIGSRYATNTAASATYRFTPPESGTYSVYVTWGNSQYGDTSVHHTVNYEGNKFETDLNQVQGGGGNGVWTSLGSYSFLAGKEYTVVQTNPTIDPAGHRLMADAVKWSIACNCASVPTVSTKVPHMTGDTKVKVTGVNANATKVSVYIDGAKVKEVTLPGSGSTTSEVEVTLDAALAAGQRVNATQTMPACDPPITVEGCVPVTGPLVGNPAQIPAVTALPVLKSGDTEVVVAGVDSAAKAVSIYADGVGPALKVLNNPTVSGSDNRVTVTGVPALANGKKISATQTLQSVGGSGANLEGNIPSTGPTVDDRAQVPAVTIAGLVDQGRKTIRVMDVVVGTPPAGYNKAASVVKVYASDGTTLLGSAPATGATTVVTLAAGLDKNVYPAIKATQVINGIEGNIPAAGRRIMEAGIMEDFEDGVTASDNLLPAPKYRVWYDVSNIAYTDSYAATLNGKCLDVLDSGWTNGAYAKYEQIIPENEPGGAPKRWHLQIKMLVDEQGADPDEYNTYQVGVLINGAHRDAGGILPNITTIVGNYMDLTPNQDGKGTPTEQIQTVYTTSFLASAGDDLLIAFSTSCNGYTRNKTADPNRPGMLIDDIKLVEGEVPCVCDRVGPVSVTTGPLSPTTTEITVTGITASVDVIVKKVTVYAYNIANNTWSMLGSLATIPSGATQVIVPVSGLDEHEHEAVVATQSIACGDLPNGIEGCGRKVGPVIGTGTNSNLLVSLGVRENTALTGPVGADGGETGDIEWIGPSTSVNGAPQGKKVSIQPGWQTLTFYPVAVTEPEPHAKDHVLSFNNGNGVLDGAWGVFEHLAFAIDATAVDTGPYTIYLDNIKSGDTLITDFEAYSTGTQVMFDLPNFSSTTLGNILLPTNKAEVVDTENDGTSAGKALMVQFQYVDELQKRWVRLTTAKKSTTAPQPISNPEIDLTKPISIRIKLGGLACGDVFADRDGDGDVDQADFGVFQECYTGQAQPEYTPVIAAGCECFDRDQDKDIDAADLIKFTNCWSGPAIPAVKTCDD